MGSIIARGGKWRAQVRRKGYAAQCKTFRTKAQAEAWMRRIEGAIEAGETPAAASGYTVSDVIRAYRQLRQEARPIADDSTEHYTLRKLDLGLGHLLAARVTPDDLIAYAVMRRDEDGAGEYTINCDLSKLGTVMRYGAARLRVALPDAVGAARPLLSHLRLIGGGGKRERRPTQDEAERIVDHLRLTYVDVYADAVLFAAITAMRRGEICALMRSDIDVQTRCARVMRKHPRRGKALGVVPLLGKAFALATKREPQCFPVHPQTLSKYFLETCRALGIPDLHFHDLRHEATSAMFEAGMAIQEVALVTGHQTWAHLRRYTNLKPEDLVTRPTPAPDQSTRPRPDSPPSASRRRDRS